MNSRGLETTSAETIPTEVTPAAGRSITIETALYIGVFGLALFLRLFRLNLAPLSESEAAQALAALRDTSLPFGGSPLLYSLNSALMALFSPGDAIVRVVPALVGSAMVLAPALFRDALGRLGALGAALILALSPVGLVASRSVGGQVIVVASVLAFIALLHRYLSTREERHLIGAAVALALGLTAGPGMYTALAAMLIGLVVLRFALGGESSAEWDTAWRAIAEAPARWKTAAAFVGALVLAATGGLTHPAGLGAAGDVLSAWLSAFGSGGGSQAFDVVQVLIVYEALALVAGVVGMVRVTLRRGRTSPSSDEDTAPGQDRSEEPFVPFFAPWLGFTAITSLVIVMMQSGRQPTDLLLPVTLLALLAAYVIQPWLESLIARASVEIDGVILMVGAAVVAFLMLTLTSFVRGRILPILFVSAVVPDELMTLAIFVIVIGLVGVLLVMMYDMRSVLRTAATLALSLLALASFSAGWGATQVRVGDAREIIWGAHVTTPGIRLVVDTVEQIAIRSQGHTGTLPIRVEAGDPVVAWYLRDARIEPGGTAAGVVTPFGEQPQEAGAGYIGARFNIRETWDALGLNFDAWLEWALFRENSNLPPLVTQTVTVWERR